jgi:transmembrane sensor
MKDTEFDRLTDRYLKGQLNAKDKQKVDAWLDQMAEDNSAELSPAEQAIAADRIFQQLTEKIAATPKDQPRTLMVKLRPFLKVAACIAVFSLLLFGFRNPLKAFFNIGQFELVSNTNGQITKSILADGTIVWLKGNSQLHFPVKFKDSLRVVDLSGEALFEVAKDAKHPFIIHCGTLTTRVLGTSFNIKQSKEKTEVAVLTGRVLLRSKNAGSVDLLPFQQGLYQEHQKTLVKEARPALKVAELTKGTEYDMLFNDVRLAEVLKRIDKKFEVNIAVKDAVLNNQLVTADFTDQSLKNTLDMIDEALNLTYDLNDSSISLRKKQK